LTQYTQAPGIPALRQAIANHYAHRHDVEVDPARVFVTPGASGGLTLLTHLLVGQGDGILLSDPAYPCVRNFLHLADAEPQLVKVGPEQNFQPTVDLLSRYRTAKSVGLWLASPSNPCGTVIDRERLAALANWTRESNLHLLVDEIYHGLHYVQDMPGVLEFTQDAYVVNSFSKYFGMTGWRLGWIVVPEDAIEMTTRLAQNLYISAPSIAQYAALAAFTDEATEIFEARRREFQMRGEYLQRALTELGFEIAADFQGAFYLWADISRFSDNCEQFCQQVLQRDGVAITPGTDFGVASAQRFVRVAFTTSREDLEEGVARLRRGLASGDNPSHDN
jgi:aspartate/methionine/tyrosine aminotransferase